MKFYLRTVLGTLIALGAVVLFLFGIYQLARGGTCASGGPYVSTKECASGSTAWMFALPPVLLAGLCGLWLVALRGPRPGAAQPEPAPAPTATPWRGGRPFVVPSAQPVSAPDPIDRLAKLQALRNAGVLSADEFQQAKAKIIAEM